jgi:hypothetical protein
MGILHHCPICDAELEKSYVDRALSAFHLTCPNGHMDVSGWDSSNLYENLGHQWNLVATKAILDALREDGKL